MTNIQEAMKACGVTETTLSLDEKKSLDEKGYVIFQRLVDSVWLKQLQDTYERLMEKEGQSAGLEVHQEAGTRRLSDLVNKGEVFDRFYTHPRLLAAVYHVLKGEFKLSSLNGRDALPGQGHQGLHGDWDARVLEEPFHVCNSIWMLDDFTQENGATRVVPGSHLLKGGPADYMKDPEASHPDQMCVMAPAGSVVVINAHLWHSGTTNHTKGTRRGLHCCFTAREHGQQTNQREYIRKSIFDRISPAARYLLDVDPETSSKEKT